MAKDGNQGGDYEVGYGRLPKHSRWVKGQPGNPHGHSEEEPSL